MSFLRVALRRLRPGITAYRQTSAAISKNNTPAVTVWRTYSSSSAETDEEFDARWEAYFNRKDIDGWELRTGLNELYGHDLVPEPKIVAAMIRAARRLNDVALAIRILEAVKEKAAGSQEIYSHIIREIRPVLDELGLETPEELGLA